MKLKTENQKLRITMRCEKFEPMASDYIDQELSATELQVYRAHIDLCTPCSQHLQELEETSLFFKEVRRPEVPRELHSYVMTAIERRASGEVSLRQGVMEWMLTLNPRPFSFATGALFSIVLFAITLAGFKPLPVSSAGPKVSATAVLWATAPPLDPILSSLEEYDRLNNISAKSSLQNNDFVKASSTNSYEIPRMINSSSTASFGYLAYPNPGNESMTAWVEVDRDGRSKLIDVIDEPKDPMAVEQLWWFLHERTFQPAIVDGQPVATRIIFFAEKVDVSG
jgi:hypothetical protein